MHPGRRKSTAAFAVLSVVAVLATSACSMSVKGGSTAAANGSMLVGADNGSPTFEKNFNPYAPNKRVGTTYMYEPLEVVNTLDGKETPFLATGHTAPDTKTVVFDIRTGVKWSDGKPFSASDVAFTFQLLKDHKELDLKGVWQRVDSVAVDGQKVTFNLKTDDVPAAKVIEQTLIVPEHVWKSIKDPVKDTNAKPVVTGPYVLARSQRTRATGRPTRWPPTSSSSPPRTPNSTWSTTATTGRTPS